MKLEIKNIADLLSQIRPLSDLTLNKDISFLEALNGSKYHYDLLESAIENYNNPNGKSFFENTKRSYSIEEAKLLLHLIKGTIEILETQLAYRKHRVNGTIDRIEYFEWD